MPIPVHSVTLDEEKCRGCTNCIKKCPTEAIRVRKGKAVIITDRCIDCGECIRVCPYHAKKAISDSLDQLNNFEYRVAIPAPSLYGQFKEDVNINMILTGLKKLGFDEVYEVASAAEIVSDASMQIAESGGYPKPIISSACPAVLRLIQVRFPSLLKHVIRIDSPMEVAARMVKEKLKPLDKKVGVFFISPCPAKVTSVRNPIGREKSCVDGVIAIKDIYRDLLNAINYLDRVEDLASATGRGIGWANIEGESTSSGYRNHIAVDGIHNVINVLEEMENGNLEVVDFVEALACPGGCVGGPLTVENAYIAKTRIRNRAVESASRQLHSAGGRCRDVDIDIKTELPWTKDVEFKQVLKLDDDFATAIRKMEEIKRINECLPGLDCGSCGAPSCRALAEDIVRGDAVLTDCVFKLREKVRVLALELMKLEEKQPPGLDKESKDDLKDGNPDRNHGEIQERKPDRS